MRTVGAHLLVTMTSRSDRDLDLTGGRLRVRDHGGGGGLVLCVPGLSANATSFDVLAEQLAGPSRQVVSVDLRGRGFSEVTAPGTYGWPAHARDVLEAAHHLGGGPADLIGHSMGAYVVMAAAAIEPAAVRRLVLIDGLGVPEPASLGPIMAGLERLGTVHDSVESYIGGIRALRVVEPWGEHWDRYYRYDLEPVQGGVRSRTDRAAVLEDVQWGIDHPQSDLWGAITQPTLLVRALRPIGDGGFIVSAADRDAFLREFPLARVAEVDANHYAIVADAAAAGHIHDFLDEVME
jgi:pimeloyl-ACP methyl ester carboxylesterase